MFSNIEYNILGLNNFSSKLNKQNTILRNTTNNIQHFAKISFFCYNSKIKEKNSITHQKAKNRFLPFCFLSQCQKHKNQNLQTHQHLPPLRLFSTRSHNNKHDKKSSNKHSIKKY